MDVTTDGSSYFTGFHSSTAATLGTNTLPVVTGLDLWIAKFDTAGNSVWVTNSGTSTSDIARAITHTASGSTYVTGEAGAEIFNNPSFEPKVFIVELRPTVTLPQLAITHTSTDLVISWPASETGWVIETTETLGTGFQRGQVTFTPVVGQTNAYSTPLATDRLFIRLAKP